MLPARSPDTHDMLESGGGYMGRCVECACLVPACLTSNRIPIRTSDLSARVSYPLNEGLWLVSQVRVSRTRLVIHKFLNSD